MRRVVLIAFVLAGLAAPLFLFSMKTVFGQTTINGLSTNIGGIPTTSTANNYLGNTAPITNQVECSAASCPAGEYLVMVSMTPTNTATLGSMSLTLSFTDSGQAQTVAAITGMLLTSKVPATAVYPFWSTGVAPITWSTTVTGVTGVYSYDIHVRLVRLG